MLVVGYLYPKDPLEKLTIALYHREIFFSFFQGYVIQFFNIALKKECSSSGFLKRQQIFGKIPTYLTLLSKLQKQAGDFFIFCGLFRKPEIEYSLFNAILTN